MFLKIKFVFRNDEEGKEEIKSLPGVYRHGYKSVIDFLTPIVERGLKAVLLFGVPGDSAEKVRGIPIEIASLLELHDNFCLVALKTKIRVDT